jgi:serine-type D-Ala-D-Ala carboxypeptidase (penicillin-binding protein 5/6)
MRGFLHNKDLTYVYFILPILLFVVFLIIFGANLFLKIWNDENEIVKPPVNLSTSLDYPVVKNKFVPSISATGAIIMDANSKIVLYSKNPDLRFSSASTTKIMTAIIASDYFKSTGILTVGNKKVEGSVLGLFQNQQISFGDLMYAMLLPSANDAALTIAENYPGGEKEFVAQMNNRAKIYNLKNTHYGDPIGLEDNLDFTTPFDLARLTSFAMQKPLIKEVVATKEKTISDVNGANVYKIENLNTLLGVDGVNGVKTGYTEEAGQVLVTSKNEKGKNIIIVVMGSEDRILDTQKLLDLIRDNVTYLPIHP